MTHTHNGHCRSASIPEIAACCCFTYIEAMKVASETVSKTRPCVLMRKRTATPGMSTLFCKAAGLSLSSIINVDVDPSVPFDSVSCIVRDGCCCRSKSRHSIPSETTRESSTNSSVKDEECTVVLCLYIRLNRNPSIRGLCWGVWHNKDLSGSRVMSHSAVPPRIVGWNVVTIRHDVKPVDCFVFFIGVHRTIVGRDH